MPNEWDNYTIGDIVKFEGGAQPPRSEFISYPKEGYIRLIQIRDYKTNEYLTFIPLKKARKFCTEDDVMIGRYGPPIFQILRGIKGAYNVALMKAIPAEDKLHKDYLYYYLQNETLFILIDKLSRRSSGQTGIDIEALNQFPFPLPPKNEQERIINIIKTWDQAIELKEKLIDEKKKQKTGLMQKLLTGKVRLPGFDKEWVNVKLKKILKQRNEKSEIKEGLELYSLTIEDGVTPKTDRYNREFLVKSGNKKYKITKCNDIVYNPANLRFGAIAVNRIGQSVLLSPIYEVLYIKDEKKYDIDFVGQLLTWDRNIKYFSTMAEGTLVERMAVKIDAFLDVAFKFPPSLEEQKAIASILSLADKEICILKKEVISLKKQKKGLMQLLLTGIIRVNTQENEKR